MNKPTIDGRIEVLRKELAPHKAAMLIIDELKAENARLKEHIIELEKAYDLEKRNPKSWSDRLGW